ncbi:MAG: hypothetical protein KUG74_14025 [Rhodobacteraceae bacterium]|nr:hypothetical protein [Paracoccaceae bacterium]
MHLIWTKRIIVGALAITVAVVVLALLGVSFLLYLISNEPVELPRLQAFVEDRINDQLADETLSIGAISLSSDQDGTANRIILRDVTLFDTDHKKLLNVPEIRTDFSLVNLFSGTISPSEIEIVGTRLKLIRERDGNIRFLRLNAQGDTVFEGDILARVDAFLQRKELKNLHSIALRDTDILVEDVRSGHSWDVSESLVQFSRTDDVLDLRTEVYVDTFGGERTNILAKAKHKIGSKKADLFLQFSNAAPNDLADMVGAFDWIRIFDTRISGSMTASVSNDGTVGDINGVLDLGQGRLLETPTSLPIGFDQAKVYFAYSKAHDRLEFSQIKLDTTSGKISSEGYAVLERTPEGGVGAMAGQFSFANILLSRPDAFSGPLELDGAGLDFRVSFNPLKLEVGALTVFDGAATYRLAGESVAQKDFWVNRYDIEVSNADNDRVMAFWPIKAIPKTRKWLVENITEGQVSNFRGGLRSKEGKFKYAFNFDIKDAQVRFMKTMPELRDGQGYGYLTHNDLRIELQSGYLIAADDTVVDGSGSSFYIPDITARPALGEVIVSARGGLQAALHLLDAKKFEFLKKVGLTPSVASGKVAVSGTLQVPLTKKTKPKDVLFNAVAEVKDLASDTLVKGHALRASSMRMTASEKGLEMLGPITLDTVPMQARWRLGFGRAAAKGSEVVADVGLSQENLDGLGITLPKGSVSGEALAKVVVNIKKNQIPTYTVVSDLVGAVLKVPALQWVKSSKSSGKLEVAGSFGVVPTVDALALTAPGMKARGKIDFNPDGKMKALRLSSLRAGRWLDTSAVLEMSPSGQANITLSGGAADMRNFNISGGTGGEGSTGGGLIDVSLDRLTILTGIALTNFKAKLEPGKGMTGSFTGRVNGDTPISGTMFPHKFGTAFEIQSDDAGRVLAAADLMDNVYGGDLWVIIVPRATEGEYDGTLKIKRTRMTNTSAMAGLMNGISVVGLLQQLEGDGIHFSTVSGKFLMRPNGVQIKDISAVGPSIGITLDGWYNSTERTVDFEGVTTPLYALNGLFERTLGKLGGRKKGEGLFSFTYRMRGHADDPKVTVNPLSILTPGAFREIFRTKVPAPAGGAEISTDQPREQDSKLVTKEAELEEKHKPLRKKKMPFTRPDNQDLR